MTDLEKARILADSLEAWGECDLQTRHSHGRIWQQLEKLFAPMLSAQSQDIGTFLGNRGLSYYQILDRYCPAPAESDSKLLAIYKSKAHKDSERRTIGKPHKMVKYILPYLTDAECHEFAQWYRDNVQIDSDKLTLEIGETRADFKRVYTSETIPGDPNCSNGRKSLTASCMRYKFDNLSAHPCEAYASGHFRIVFVKDAQNRIGARAIVRPENKTHAPIYVSYNAAGDKLEAWLSDNEYTAADNRAFNGASLLYIENGKNCVIAPYLDICRDVEIDTENEEITICRNGNMTFNNTCGFYAVESCTCDDCGNNMSEDDSIYVESCERTICESCFNANYFTCENDGNIYHDNEAVQVYYAHNRYNTYSRAYVESCDDIIFVDSDGEYWDSDCTIYVESISEYYLTDDIGDKIFQSDLDQEYYLIEEQIELSNGQFWTREQVTESDHFDIVKELIKEKDDCPIYKETAYLKPWLEYDADGDVINHQPDLPLAA